MSEDIKKNLTESKTSDTDVEKPQAEGELSEEQLEDVAGGRGKRGGESRLGGGPKRGGESRLGRP